MTQSDKRFINDAIRQFYTAVEEHQDKSKARAAMIMAQIDASNEYFTQHLNARAALLDERKDKYMEYMMETKTTLRELTNEVTTLRYIHPVNPPTVTDYSHKLTPGS